MSLKEEILQRLENDVLFEWHDRYPSMRIDNEIARRLSSCDYSVLDYLKDITPPIEKGLSDLRKCINWKVGVVYEYTTGRIKNVEVFVGKPKKYQVNGRPVSFTWLDSNKHKLMLREVVSSSSPHIFKISARFQGDSLDVLDHLLKKKVVNVKVGYFPGVPSYGNPLTYAEKHEIIPLEMDNFKFFNYSPNTFTVDFPNVPIQFSPDVLKYLNFIKR